VGCVECVIREGKNTSESNVLQKSIEGKVSGRWKNNIKMDLKGIGQKHLH
jgi:hypothetical protein